MSLSQCSVELGRRSLHQVVSNHRVGRFLLFPLSPSPSPFPSSPLHQAGHTERALEPEWNMGLRFGHSVTPSGHLSCPFLRPTSGRSHPELSSTVPATKSSPPWTSTWSLLATPYQVKEPPHPVSG